MSSSLSCYLYWVPLGFTRSLPFSWEMCCQVLMLGIAGSIKMGIKFCSSLGEVWVMAKLSKKTCCRRMGLLGHLLSLGSHSQPCCAKWLWVWERPTGITALQRARDPTSMKESLWPASGTDLQLMFIDYIFFAGCRTENPISVCLYNFDSLPPLYRWGNWSLDLVATF